MTKRLRIIGAIVALTGAIFYFLTIGLGYITTFSQGVPIVIPVIYIMSIFTIAVLGCILLFMDRNLGGILPIISGVMITIGLFINFDAGSWSGPLSNSFLFEIILLIAGGIMALVVGTE